MKHTPPTSKTFGEMLEELMDLSTGVGVALMPLLLLAMPGIILFVVLPGILLLALAVPLAVIVAVIVAPYLLVRRLRRRRRPTTAPPAADRGLRPVRTSGQSQVRSLGLG